MQQKLISSLVVTAFLSLSPLTAQAGATVPGSSCQAANGDLVVYTTRGIYNPNSTWVSIVCPVSVPHKIGPSIGFAFRMLDNNNGLGNNVGCSGVILDQNAASIPLGTSVNSGTGIANGSTYTGERAISLGTTITAAQMSDKNTFVATCSLPTVTTSGMSGIVTVRVE